MKFRNLTLFVVVAASAALFSTSQAQEMIYSGFMTDYSQLVGDQLHLANVGINNEK